MRVRSSVLQPSIIPQFLLRQTETTHPISRTLLPAAALLCVIERIPSYQCGSATEHSFLLLNCTGHHQSEAEYPICPSNIGIDWILPLGIKGKTHLLSVFKKSLLTTLLRPFVSSWMISWNMISWKQSSSQYRHHSSANCAAQEIK